MTGPALQALPMDCEEYMKTGKIEKRSKTVAQRVFFWFFVAVSIAGWVQIAVFLISNNTGGAFMVLPLTVILTALLIWKRRAFLG
jgi:hypothetical protein